MLDDNAFSEHETESASWIALSDLMTGLMAIFLVLCLLALTNQDRARVVIIQTVQDTMKAENIKVEVDPKTGDISIADNILFALGSAQLSPEGKSFLREFIPVYSSVLFDKLTQQQLDQVARIAVEGHTSQLGGYASNMKLSLERANAVVQFIDQEMAPFAHKEQLKHKLTPAGRGPLDAREYETNEDRKVTFRFQLASELFETTKDDLINNSSRTLNANGLTQVFHSPQSHVFCAFQTPNDGSDSQVRCYSDEMHGIQYLPMRHSCQSKMAFSLSPTGVEVQCNPNDDLQVVIYEAAKNSRHVLSTGQSIVIDDITCLSRDQGITCSNNNGQGFFMSRLVQDFFGVSREN